MVFRRCVFHRVIQPSSHFVLLWVEFNPAQPCQMFQCLFGVLLEVLFDTHIVFQFWAYFSTFYGIPYVC